MTTTQIDILGDMIADETAFPARNGYREASSPSFIFFDDDKALDPDIAWGRELAVDFEEWVATQNHNEALDSRREEKAMVHKRVMMPYTASRERKTDDDAWLPRAPLPKPTEQDLNRGKMFRHCFTRKDTPKEVTIRDITDDYEHTVTEEAYYELCQYSNLNAVVEDNYNRLNPRYDDQGVLLNPFLGIALKKTQGTPVTYSELQEAQRTANWHVGFAKSRAITNDHWRKLVTPLSTRLDESDPLASTCRTILRTMKEALPFAPGPARGTLFVNPDGSKFHSASNNFGSAKASYIKRHGLTDEFVSVDRVQKEGERHSTYVVGIRKTSDSVPSNYFDPNPSWQEKKRDGQWVKAYNPCACNLYRVPESMVMPSGSHRLSVREFEQAVIAGADTLDSADELVARQFETDPMPDTRVMLLNMGDGCDGRDPSALTHEETYLYNILRMFGEEQACQLMLLENQEPGLLHTHFMSHGQYGQVVVQILRFVAKDPEAREDGVLPFVISALTNRPQDEIETRMDLKSRSRDNKRVLSKEHEMVDYGFAACVADNAYTESEDEDT